MLWKPEKKLQRIRQIWRSISADGVRGYGKRIYIPRIPATLKSERERLKWPEIYIKSAGNTGTVRMRGLKGFILISAASRNRMEISWSAMAKKRS